MNNSYWIFYPKSKYKPLADQSDAIKKIKSTHIGILEKQSI